MPFASPLPSAEGCSSRRCVVTAVDPRDPEKPYELMYAGGDKYWSAELHLQRRTVREDEHSTDKQVAEESPGSNQKKPPKPETRGPDKDGSSDKIAVAAH